MRTIVETVDYLPQDIRPADLMAEYKRLVARDVAELVVPAADVTVDACPGCGSTASEPAFERFGLGYADCSACGTLWVARRPPAAVLRAFYRDSEAERFWQSRLARATSSQRVHRIIEPRIDWLVDSVQEYRPDAAVMADVSTHLEVFAEHLARLQRFRRRLLIDPIAEVAADGLEIIAQPLETLGLEAELDAITLFDVLDHSSDADAVLAAAHRALKPGGLCFLTGILSSGFDIQVLWDRADTILPPDRLTMFSATGLQALLDRHGFETLEFSTPGAFDLKAVARAADADPALPLPRFVRTLLTRRDAVDHQRFQGFLQSALLSSFGRVLVRRKT